MKYILFLLVFPFFAVYGNTVQLTKELCQIEETQNYSDQNIRKAAAALTHRNYRVLFSAMRVLIQAGRRCPEVTPALMNSALVIYLFRWTGVVGVAIFVIYAWFSPPPKQLSFLRAFSLRAGKKAPYDQGGSGYLRRKVERCLI